ncbi:MAG: MerR family transcriptional regulator [Paludibacteraceae bacterium]|nr:MerR family transcriptional regulator [Paludibacteraceae bacterium]
MIGETDDDLIVWDDSSEMSETTNDSDVWNETDDEADLPEGEDADGGLSDGEEPSVYEKKYFKISEVETIIGETQSTIRFWEDQFSVLGKNFCSCRSRKGTRKFTKENIENLQLLKLLLRERRLTIEGAISEIRNERKRNTRDRALTLLLETREELNRMIDAYNLILHQNSD